MRLIDHFDRGTALAPEAICLRDEAGSHSYAEVTEASHKIAQALSKAGIRAGDVVATLGPNSAGYFLAVLGIVRLGAIWLPLNARFAAAELSHALGSNDCVFVFSAGNHAALVQDTLGELGRSRDAVVCLDEAVTDLPSLSDWIANARADPVDAEQDADTVVAIRSTGGTTGPSKGVMISNRNYETLFANLLSSTPFPAAPVHLVVAPLSHAAGTLNWVTFAHSGRNVVLARFDAEEVLRRIQAEKVTHLFLTPTMIYMLLDHPQIGAHDYSSLRMVVYAGAPMSVDKLKRAIEIFGPVFLQGYGQAEAPFFCTILKPEEHVPLTDPAVVKRLASCGRATPFARVEIMDPEGRLLPAGERGEIVVRGDLVMKGYYKNPEATTKAARFGWHHTGDIGLKDQDGYLYIVDRERDIIISGGFNIYPNEIEQVIWSHSSVQDCAVIGVPDDLWGEAVRVVVELRPGGAADERELIDLCADRLGRMKAPKAVEFWPSLPRSPVGKVLKREIRERFWSGRDRAV